MKIIKYFFEFISIISLFCIFKIIGLKNASNLGSVLGRLIGPLFRPKKIIKQNINEFKNKKVIAFAGIGNPDNFFNLLKDNKIDIVEEIKFPDHHKYSEETLENLINKTKESNTILLTTEKDYFRIDKNYKQNINFLKIEVEIENRNQFIDEIKKVI